MSEAIERWTTNPLPGFKGSIPIEAGGTMEIVVDNIVYTTKLDAITGDWRWTSPIPLNDGAHNLSFRVIDLAGNIGAPLLLILNVDTTAPDQPEILRVIDDVGSQQHWLTPGSQTDDRRPSLSGSAEAGSIVRLYDNGNEIGSTLANTNGRWEITPASDLADGAHNLNVTSTDRVGHISPASDTFSIIVQGDALPPIEKPKITHAFDDVGSTGIINSGDSTDDNTPQLFGTAGKNQLVYLHYGKKGKGNFTEISFTAHEDGNWSWTAPKLANASWEFAVKNASGDYSAKFELSINFTVPRPVIEDYYDNVGVTGYFSSGSTTDDTTPTLRGSAEPYAKVQLQYFSGGSWQSLSNVTANSYGDWSFTTHHLSNANYSFRARAESGGATSGWSNTFSLTVNYFSPPPQAPSIDYFYDSQNVRDGTGNKYSGSITDDISPTLHGKGVPGATIRFESYLYTTASSGYWAGEQTTVIVDRNGNWQATFFPLTSTDTHYNHYNELTIRAIANVGGVSSSPSSSFYIRLYDVTLIPDGIRPFESMHLDGELAVAYKTKEPQLLEEIQTVSTTHDAPPLIAINGIASAQGNLVISLADVLAKGEVSTFIDDDKTQLLIQGDPADKVQLKEILLAEMETQSWAEQAGTVTVAGTQYHVYSSGDAELLVQEGVQLELV